MPAEPRAAYEAALRGDLPAASRCLVALDDDPTPLARAWEAALRALLWFAGAAAPSAGPLAGSSLPTDSPRERAVTALAVSQAVRASVLAFDLEGLRRSGAALTRLVAEVASTEAHGWGVVARGWERVVQGNDVGPDLEDTVRQATREGHADLVIEAMTVRALGAANAGALDDALKIARRASRMARTESMPQLEYLANLVLARLRRATGRPHLATRILSALLAVASAPWRGWLTWELVLAHGHAPRGSQPPGAARSLEQMIDAARAGDRAAFGDRFAEAECAVEAFAALHEDLRLLRALVDPEAPVSAAIEAFCAGREPAAPWGLEGVCGDLAEESEPLAWVLAPPHAPARRLLAPGAGLARALGPTCGHESIDGRQLRTDSAIALLALSGHAGLDEDDLFRRLYGFAYEPARHQSVRAVLYGRVRKRLGAAAALERTGGRVRLVHEAALLVPDPRCTPPAELRILRVLAERRQGGAREVAEALGIPLRTAQDALHRLAEDGALRAERRARGLHYFLEDTTFSEPTQKGRI
jgi:IclR-like helix-turn-helix domain-containing protein